jgi:hypothetical protein
MSDTTNAAYGGQKPDQTNPNPAPQTNPKSPSQQRPPTDNERKGGPEQDDKVHRSNLAGDQDVDEPVETEEGRSPDEGHA